MGEGAQYMIAHTSTDTQLAVAWTTGDEGAYSAIVDRYWPMVAARCSRVLPPADADDATQAVFLVLLRRAPQAAASPKLAAWLLRVTDNVCRNAHRDRRRRLKRQSRLLCEPVTETTEDKDMDALKEHLDAAIAQLPKREREAVCLHHLAGHSYAEIAKDLGLSTTTVSSRAHKGLERLRSILAKRGVTASISLLLALFVHSIEASAGKEVIKSWDPSVAESGLTTTEPSAFALRWSQRTISPMTTYSLIGAAALAIGASFFIQQLFTSEAPAEQQIIVMDEHSSIPQNNLPELRHDPLDYQTITLFQIHDPQRSWQRFLGGPEANLIPTDMQAKVSEVVATLGNIRLALDPNSGVTRSLLEQQRALLDAFAKAQGRERMELMQKLADQTSQLSPADHYRVNARAELNFKDNGNDRHNLVMDEIISAIAPIFSSRELHIAMDSEMGLKTKSPELDKSVSDELPLKGNTQQGSFEFIRSATSLKFQSSPGHSDRPWIWDNHPIYTSTVAPEADFALLSYAENPQTGHANKLVEVTGRFNNGNLEIKSLLGWHSQVERQRASTKTLIDTQLLAEFPADTLVAAAVSLENGAFGDSDLIQAFLMQLGSVSPNAKATANALTGCLIEATGPLLVAVRQGSFIPLIQVELPTQESAVNELLKQLEPIGFIRSDDGIYRYNLGMATLSLVWHNDRLILSSEPDEIVQLFEHQTSLTEHEEITKTIASMPAKQGSHMVVIRRAALIEQFAPILSATQANMDDSISNWIDDLKTKPHADWILQWPSEDGWHINAHGVATGIIALSSAGPVMEAMKGLNTSN